MEDKEVKQRVADTIFQEGIDFYITVANPGILHRLGIRKKQKYFVIYPLVMGTMVRISHELLEFTRIGEEDLKEENILEFGLEQIMQHKDRMIKIIGLAVTNDREKPSKKLIRFLDRNLTANEMLQVLNIVVRQVDVKDFLKSIISIKGMSLHNQGGQIAPGEPSAE